MPDDVVLAIDVGGTKFAAALIDGAGRLRRREEHPTPHGVDAEHTWTVLDRLLTAVVGSAEPVAVGCGCGGPMRWPDGIVNPLNIPAWRDFPLRERLATRFPQVPVRIHNDAISMAAGEHWLGSGRGRRSFLGVVVSTGVGGGYILDGAIVSGPTGNAGHVGHVVVDPHGPPCVCGGRGCVEAIARGPAIVEWATRQGWTGDATARAVAADASRGHPVALAALARAGQAVGVALASTAAVLDLDVIGVGGGVAQAGELLFAPLREAFGRHAQLPFAARAEVVPATLGRDAGLVGAAALVLRSYWSPPD